MSYEIINEVVKEFAGNVVRYVVDDIVHNHMTVIKADDWLIDFTLEGVAPMVQTVVRTCFNILLYLKKDSTQVFPSAILLFTFSLYLLFNSTHTAIWHLKTIFHCTKIFSFPFLTWKPLFNHFCYYALLLLLSKNARKCLMHPRF